MARQPVGVVLAGGHGRRLGGQKATVELHGRPLIAHVLDAMCGALEEVAIAARPDTELPRLPAGVDVWLEPEGPRHPLGAIAQALVRSARAVVVCAVDLPLVSTATISRLASAGAEGVTAIVACAGERVQPLLGRFEPAARPVIEHAGPDARAVEVILAMTPRLLEVDPGELLNINTRADLRAARRTILTGSQPKVNE